MLCVYMALKLEYIYGEGGGDYLGGRGVVTIWQGGGW